MSQLFGIAELACVCGCCEYKEVLKFRPPYEIVECQNCGLRRTFPPLEGVTRTQACPSDSVQHRLPISDDIAARLNIRKAEWARLTLKEVKRFISSGALVDIGCGSGRLAQLAAQEGFQVLGLDTDQSWFPKNALSNLYFIVADAHALSLREKIVDVVTMHQVLEHVVLPAKCLQEILRILKPGGLLFLSVPNHEGLIPRLIKASWSGYIPWSHRWHFSPRSLKELLQITGFCIIRLHLRSLDVPEIQSRLKQTAYQLLNFIQRQIGMGDNIIAVARHAVGEEKSRGLELKC